MAITSVKLVDVSTSSTAFWRKYTARYLVRTDAPTTDLLSIVTHPSIPSYGAEYEHDTFAVVSNKTGKQSNQTRDQFTVIVEYEPREGSGHNHLDDEFNNPLDAPSEYTWGFASRNVALTQDIHGNLIRNTAGQVFIPNVEKKEYDAQLTIVQNLEDYNPILSWNTIGRVNSEEFSVAGFDVSKKVALCTERSATSEVFTDTESDDVIEYWQVKTVLQIRRPDLNPVNWKDIHANPVVDVDLNNAWYSKILNAGIQQLKDAGDLASGLIGIPDADAVDVTKPTRLNLLGKFEPNVADAIWVVGEIYESVNFGELEL